MISVAVMAHPSRAHWVPGLLDSLDADAQVVWDQGWNDRHVTGLHALRAYDPEASHHLVVQDDAIVCRDLVAGVARAVETSGEHPLALYLGGSGPYQSLVKGRLEAVSGPWLAMEGPWWGVAVVVPTAHIDELTAFYETSDIENYDRRMARWYRTQGIDCWYTVPCLVDHRVEDNPSLTGRTGRQRRAVQFVGRDASALDLDYSQPPARAWFPDEITVPATFTSPYPQLRCRVGGRVIRFRDGRYVAHDQEVAELLATTPLPIALEGAE